MKNSVVSVALPVSAALFLFLYIWRRRAQQKKDDVARDKKESSKTIRKNASSDDYTEKDKIDIQKLLDIVSKADEASKQVEQVPEVRAEEQRVDSSELNHSVNESNKDMDAGDVETVSIQNCTENVNNATVMSSSLGDTALEEVETSVNVDNDSIIVPEQIHDLKEEDPPITFTVSTTSANTSDHLDDSLEQDSNSIPVEENIAVPDELNIAEKDDKELSEQNNRSDASSVSDTSVITEIETSGPFTVTEQEQSSTVNEPTDVNNSNGNCDSVSDDSVVAIDTFEVIEDGNNESNFEESVKEENESCSKKDSSNNVPQDSSVNAEPNGVTSAVENVVDEEKPIEVIDLVDDEDECKLLEAEQIACSIVSDVIPQETTLSQSEPEVIATKSEQESLLMPEHTANGIGNEHISNADNTTESNMNGNNINGHELDESEKQARDLIDALKNDNVNSSNTNGNSNATTTNGNGFATSSNSIFPTADDIPTFSNGRYYSNHKLKKDGFPFTDDGTPYDSQRVWPQPDDGLVLVEGSMGQPLVPDYLRDFNYHKSRFMPNHDPKTLAFVASSMKQISFPTHQWVRVLSISKSLELRVRHDQRDMLLDQLERDGVCNPAARAPVAYHLEVGSLVAAKLNIPRKGKIWCRVIVTQIVEAPEYHRRAGANRRYKNSAESMHPWFMVESVDHYPVRSDQPMPAHHLRPLNDYALTAPFYDEMFYICNTMPCNGKEYAPEAREFLCKLLEKSNNYLYISTNCSTTIDGVVYSFSPLTCPIILPASGAIKEVMLHHEFQHLGLGIPIYRGIVTDNIMYYCLCMFKDYRGFWLNDQCHHPNAIQKCLEECVYVTADDQKNMVAYRGFMMPYRHDMNQSRTHGYNLTLKQYCLLYKHSTNCSPEAEDTLNKNLANPRAVLNANFDARVLAMQFMTCPVDQVTTDCQVIKDNKGNMYFFPKDDNGFLYSKPYLPTTHNMPFTS